jgi:hypothetical protein
MYQVTEDYIGGIIKITDSWTSSGTGSFAPPKFLSSDDEYSIVFTDLKSVDKLKSFTYSSIGELQNRYLDVTYRVSRDKVSWSVWQNLNTNIQNLPPFSPLDTIWFQIKFTRSGSFNKGKITLLSYSLSGSLLRNVVTNLGLDV